MSFFMENEIRLTKQCKNKKKELETDFHSFFFFVTLKMETNYIYVTIIIHFQNNPVSYSSSSLNGLNSLFFFMFKFIYYFCLSRNVLFCNQAPNIKRNRTTEKIILQNYDTRKIDEVEDFVLSEKSQMK